MSAEHPLDPRLGEVLRARYRVLRRIGQGGMSTVYAGEHRNGAAVAIKFLAAALRDSPEHVERFQREGRAANRVKHPGVVRMLDDGVANDGAHYLVSELLEGCTYQASLDLAPKGLPPHEVQEMLRRVLSTLEAAHAQGVIHRDIKPENLFRCHDGQIKLLDFGVSRMQDDAADIVGFEARQVTHTL